MEVDLPSLQESLGDTSASVLRVLHRGSQVLSSPSGVRWEGLRRWAVRWACCWGAPRGNNQGRLRCSGEAWGR